MFDGGLKWCLVKNDVMIIGISPVEASQLKVVFRPECFELSVYQYVIFSWWLNKSIKTTRVYRAVAFELSVYLQNLNLVIERLCLELSVYQTSMIQHTEIRMFIPIFRSYSFGHAASLCIRDRM